MKTTNTKLKAKEHLVDARLLEHKEFRKQQIKVFFITVALYATWHASRTAWSYSKKGVKESNSYFTDRKLGVFDMCFMLAYAFGQFYNGWLGDQSNLKTFLAQGTVISLVGYFLFAILARMEAYSMFVFSLCFILFGFGQSRGFPGCTAILGNWVEASRRGMILGVWNATSDNVGNILGQQIGRMIVDIYHFHWSNAIFIVGVSMIILTVVLSLHLNVHPKDAGLTVSDNTIVADSSIEEPIVEEDLPQGISFWEAFKTPGIIKYSLVFACIKASAYGLLFWLPDYLHTIMGFGAETAFVAATYEIGQFIGATGLGYITDRLGKRSIGLVVALYLSALLFIILGMLGPGSSMSSFVVVLFLAGVLFGGPQVIVGGVVSSDLGEETNLKNDVRSISTLAGIVNGCGSIAAAIIQVIIPQLKSVSFYVYFFLCLLAAALLSPTAIRDYQEKKKRASYATPAAADFELQPRSSA